MEMRLRAPRLIPRSSATWRGTPSALQQRPQVLEALVEPPQVALRAVLAQRVQVPVLGIGHERVERLPRRPLDQDHGLPRLGVASLRRPGQPPERGHRAAVLAHRGHGAPRVGQVVVVAREVEEVERVEGHGGSLRAGLASGAQRAAPDCRRAGTGITRAMPSYGECRSSEIDATPQQCFDALTDFEHLPDWQGAVKSVEVLERDAQGRGTVVEYHVDARVKTVRYRLRQDYDGAPGRLDSEYCGGDFRDFSGEWRFVGIEGGRTRVELDLNIDPGRFVPGPIRSAISDAVMRRALADLKKHLERRTAAAGIGGAAAMAEPLAGLPQVDGVSHRTVTIEARDGPLDVHVAEAGAGPPLLLLHGWPQHWYCW